MTLSDRAARSSRPSLAFLLLIIFLAVIWLAGGASRADAVGQIIVRATAWVVLVIAALGGIRPALGRDRNIAMLLGACLFIVLLQLVPLPPMLWRALPGSVVRAAAPVYEAATLWRPLSLSPGATLNAAMALVVPVAVLALVSALRGRERDRVVGVVLALVVLAMLLGALQVSGAGFANPLVGASQGEVVGPFANRNHFALFLAMGCIIAPVWAVADDRSPSWRGALCLGLIPLFILMILATGSRAGLLLGGLALAFGLAVARNGIRLRLRRVSRRVMIGIVAGSVTMLLLVVILSITADRAVSIDRAFAMDTAQDMRRRGLPVVLNMIAAYFPTGTGFGSFDPLFRLNEPDALLKPTYFNHAHNDFLEIVLDGGLLGLLLLLAAIGWWGWASVRAFRAPREYMLPRLGSAALLLVFVASIFDYPARTPMVMAMIILAAVWLSDDSYRHKASTLPRDDHHL